MTDEPNRDIRPSVPWHGSLDRDLVFLLFLRLLAWVSSSQFGELAIPRTVHVFAKQPSSLRVGKANWAFLEFFFILPLVLEEI